MVKISYSLLGVAAQTGLALSVELRIHGDRHAPPWNVLGVPINADRKNEIDRGASELETSSYMPTLATHSDYLASRAYSVAMTELPERMGEPKTS